MKKIIGVICTVAVLAMSLMLPVQAAEAINDADNSGTVISITDDLDRTVTFEKAPERVAAILGSFASAWVLAGGDLVAAAEDAWEDFNLDLSEDCVNVGTNAEINLELLLTAEPDLVIASSKSSGNVELLDSFERMGIPVLYFSVTGFDDYLLLLNKMTMLTGREDLFEENGLKVQEQINKVLEAANTALDGKEGPTILNLRVTKTSVKAKSSKDTVIGEILKDLGCVNIADGSDIIDNLTLEAIIAADPEYIFVVFQGDEATSRAQLEETLTNNPAWSGLSAVQNGNVYYMDKKLYHLKPNNRWGEAYEQVAEILFGELAE